MERKVYLFIAMSLDGYIATKEDSIDFLSIVETHNEDYGYKDFTQNIDTVIWGRKTYDKVLTLGDNILHKDKQVYVMSKNRTGSFENIEYNNDVVKLVKNLKKGKGKNIYCDGGAEIIFELLNSKLIDYIIISIIPHLLGDGIKLFKENNIEQKIKLKKSSNYPSGLVQLHYEVLN